MATNPYTRLRDACRAWAFRVEHPRQPLAMTFFGAKHQPLLSKLHQTIVTADQCLYDTVLSVHGNDIVVELRERPGPKPWELGK